MDRNDTIVAVSSPGGQSLRGLIRLSGRAAHDILVQLIQSADAAPTPRRWQPVRLRRSGLAAAVCCFVAPQSYTGQDTVELQCPGHPALLDEIVREAIAAGARLAEPGEFTFRAYAAGRIDLTRAEGIAATIAAVSDGQLAAAAHLRSGRLAGFAETRVHAIGRLLALVEAGIDFVDQEDVVPIPPAQLAVELRAEITALRSLQSRCRSWGAVEGLPRVVLVGPPSAGKSTLFNALLGRPRAVIDAAPGTTRDVLAEPLSLQTAAGRAEIMLVDLAGLDDSAACLDRSIQSLTHAAIRQADLIVDIRPKGTPATALPDGVPTLRVISKADSATEDLHEPTAILLSVHQGRGLDALRSAIAERLKDQAVSVQAEMMALQPRHESALAAATQHAESALLYVDPEARSLDAIEWVAGELRQCLDALAGLGGELTPDDVIGKVFATFCVGK